jgi:hypothetical protein
MPRVEAGAGMKCPICGTIYKGASLESNCGSCLVEKVLIVRLLPIGKEREP